MSELIRKEEITKQKKIGLTTFEKCFIPKNDPKLVKQGVEICARTTYHEESKEVENRILFFKNNRKISEIGCIHTKACIMQKVPLSDEQKKELGLEKSKEPYEIVSTESFKEIRKEIEPDQHYIALKSFVGHLVEEGIENSIIDSMKFKLGVQEGTIAYGYDLLDNTTSTQLIRALHKLDPAYSSELTLFALDYMVADVPERFKLFADDFKDVLCKLSESDIKKLDSINGGIRNISIDIQECLAHSPNIPISVMEKLSDSSWKVKSALASNGGLPPHLIRKLATDESSIVRRDIALRDDLPPDVLSFLANPKESLSVIKALLDYQPTGYLSPDQLSKFVSFEDPTIRTALAGREELSKSVFEILIDDKNHNVLMVLAENQKLPSPFISRLARSSDDDVRRRIATRTDLSPSQMQVLSEDQNPSIRATLIEKNGGSLPISVLEKLAKDDSELIRSSLSLVSFLPSDIVSILTKDKNDYIRRQMADYPSIGKDILADWIPREKDTGVLMKLSIRPSLSIQQVDHIIDTGNFKVKGNMAFFRQFLTEKQLLKLARDPEDYVRLNVAKRVDKLPKSVIETLSNDSSSAILATLKERTDLSPEIRRKITLKKLEISDQDLL